MSDNAYFWKIFSKRMIFCFILMMMLFLGTILRIAVICEADFQDTYRNLNCYKLKISNLRGTIYDCNMIPLTNNEEKIIAAVSPTEKGITAIKSVLKENEFAEIIDILKNGEPAVCEVPKDIKCDGIVTTKIRVHSGSFTPAIHLIGYVNSENHGVSGIEAAYDELLYSEKQVTVFFESDGKGNILKGSDAVIENDSNVTASGVVTTIDLNIQNIAENAGKNIDSGAIVIASAKSGKIRAMVSRPFFDCENISNYLNQKNSPLLNRAINSYNVGSVFKPCVAASGIENNYNNFNYNCTGKEKIAERYFKCHESKGHSIMTLRSALANSCNTYFYNYSSNIGGDAIYDMASSLNFGKSLKLGENIFSSSGNLPDRNSLKNIGNLANFSIGQGDLLLSPVSMLTLYCAIATDGCYYIPSVIEATVSNGKKTNYEIGQKTKVMSSKTAKSLREYLKDVLTVGTGTDATPKTVTAAGKTATAQTGKFENGIEISQGWFCGFFPLESPEYVVIIFSENTKKQIKSCNEIFAEIADNITALGN